MYAILVDECTYVENKELMKKYILYVSYLSGEISERTKGAVKIDDTSSESLFKTVVNVLSRVHLNVGQPCAQRYDWASNMNDRLSGLASLVLKKTISYLY